MSRILLTGASGRLGTHMRQWLAARGRVVLATDIAPPQEGDGVVLADLADRAAVDALMQDGITAVVHLGGMAKEAGWDTILHANIMGTYNIFEAARKAGVTRVVYASSYHVVGMYRTEEGPLELTAAPRPDSLYGVSKLFGESLSRLYFDKFGIECLAIRICTAGQPGTAREGRLWCNRDDLAELIAAGIDAPTLGHRVVFGISDNDDAFCLNSPELGALWTPKHSSRELGLPHIGEPLDPDDPRNRFLGGIFPIWGHFDDGDPRP